MSKLSDYFTAVATKTLTGTEVDPATSSQHEFNGVNSLKRILGDNPEPATSPCTFIYLSDDRATVTDNGQVTWYDSRRNDPDRSEFRLYFRQSAAMQFAHESDLLVFAKLKDGKFLAIVAAAGSSADKKLRYVFHVDRKGAQKPSSFELDESLEEKEVTFVKHEILEAIGIEITNRADEFLGMMQKRFAGDFPGTKEFSSFARETCPNKVSGASDADGTLVEWIEWEHKLFRSLERTIVQAKLDGGFSDVDEFLSYSLSVQNRRKSRMGHALENHLAELLHRRDVDHERGCRTENRAKPDFMFPGCAAYHHAEFPVQRLTMLGVKSTCKDRWRQVLSEADRIEYKHLLTLEAGISASQTDEMAANKLQLVVPAPLHDSYNADQRKWLMNVEQFIDAVKKKNP